jgi:flagellar protein FliO/FliZ
MKIPRVLPAAMLLLLATLPAHAAEAAPAGNLLQVLAGLVAVLALMAGAAWLLKRMGVAGVAGNNVARVVGGVSVGNRERVVVVEIADQWIVVGVAPGRVSALSTMPRQETPTTTLAHPGAAPAPNFSAWLKQTIDKRNGRQ